MKNWKNTLVSPATSIKKAIEVINTAALQIALVVDETQVLLGTVTDGDIRRGILNGVSLDAKVELIMNRNPITATAKTLTKSAATLTEKKLRHLPILDAGRRVVDLKVLGEVLLPVEKANRVVLMAGGMGSRMAPLTDNCPKPMLKLRDKPLLEIILGNFLRHGFKNFYVAVNYKAEMIEDYFGDGSRWGANIEYVREDKKMGTAGALSLLPGDLADPIIVMNGDLLTNVDLNQLMQFHREQKSQLTMCVREHDLEVPYGVVKMRDTQVLAIDEKPVHRFFVNAGIYVIEPDVLKLIPQAEYVDMPDLIKKLIELKQPPAAFPLREYWLDVGRQSDFERANDAVDGYNIE